MYEIASFSIHTATCCEKDSTLFSFVFGVGFMIFAKLMASMCELTLLFIRTESKLNKFFA